jgi:hypothetical protein
VQGDVIVRVPEQKWEPPSVSRPQERDGEKDSQRPLAEFGQSNL